MFVTVFAVNVSSFDIDRDGEVGHQALMLIGIMLQGASHMDDVECDELQTGMMVVTRLRTRKLSQCGRNRIIEALV